MTLLIHNISQLPIVPPGPVTGSAQGEVERITDAAVLIEGDRITRFGPQADVAAPPGTDRLDAQGGCVIPGLIDCHTHTVFAGTRENEFTKRLEGKSYAQIAKEGGGIRVTVEAVRNATCDQLVELALPRLERMRAGGVTTVEIKSGYGLTVNDELKMLQAIAKLRALQPIELVSSYLAAHTTPAEFAGRPDEYLDMVLADDVLARIRDESLAEFCDVFCDDIAFGYDQSMRVLTTCKKFGLTPRLHADQIAQIGASRLAGEVQAVSADHLEVIDDAGIAAMKAAGTVAVLLPGCSFFLNVEQAPARRLIDAGLPVAIATDYNPGSSMIESLTLCMAIGCVQMRMTPTEALVGATANAAVALGRNDRLGAIQPGFQANLVVLDVDNHDRLMYEPGRNCVRHVIVRGQVVR